MVEKDIRSLKKMSQGLVAWWAAYCWQSDSSDSSDSFKLFDIEESKRERMEWGRVELMDERADG